MSREHVTSKVQGAALGRGRLRVVTHSYNTAMSAAGTHLTPKHNICLKAKQTQLSSTEPTVQVVLTSPHDLLQTQGALLPPFSSGIFHVHSAQQRRVCNAPQETINFQFLLQEM